MTIILQCHFAFAAIWLGCVITEALFERALLSGDRGYHRTLADLHVRVDQFIEVPAILVVLGTGTWLWLHSTPNSATFCAMLIAGLIAIAANFYCVSLVFKRRDAARAEDWEQFDHLDDLQHKVGAVVLVGLLVAIFSGAAGRI
jgi:hypothetical protein